MDLATIRRRHYQDLALKWLSYSISLALVAVIVGCALHYTNAKDQSDRVPADVGVVPPQPQVVQPSEDDLKVENAKLQEENNILRNALMEANQKLAALESKQSKKSVAKKSVEKKSMDKKEVAKTTPEVSAESKPKKLTAKRKIAKVQKVAAVKKAVKKKLKIIQVTFDDQGAVQ